MSTDNNRPDDRQQLYTTTVAGPDIRCSGAEGGEGICTDGVRCWRCAEVWHDSVHGDGGSGCWEISEPPGDL